MTLGKWLKQIDIESLSISTIALWIDGDDSVLWEGHTSNIPWIYLDYKIGVHDPDDPERKPIMIFSKENFYGAHMPHFIITIIDNTY